MNRIPLIKPLITAFAILILFGCTTEEPPPTQTRTPEAAPLSTLRPTATALPAINTNTPTSEPTTANQVTATLPETSTNTPTATAMPSPTIPPWNYPPPDLVAIEPCKVIMPPNDGRPFQECSINVFASSVSNELVFQMSVEGTSYESPEFSPNGQWLTYVEKTDGRSNLRLVRTDNWENDHPLTEPFKLGYTLQNLFWSFDSQWIAFEEYNWGARYGTTYIVNIVTGEVKAVGEAIGNAFAWSPSEPSQFAFAIGEGPSSWGGIYLANTDTPQDGTLLEGTQEAFDEGSNPFFLNWHPQDPLLVMCIDKLPETGLSSSTELWLFEFSSNEWMLLDTFGKYDCGGVAWSPDGQTLAVFSSYYILFYESPDWQVSRSFSAFRTLTEVTEGAPWGGNWVSDSVFVFSLAGLQPPPSLHVHDLFAMSSTVPQPPFGMWNINVQDLPVQFDLIDEIAWYYNDPP